MYREILTHPHIGSYSALLLAGFIAAYFLGRWRATRNQIEGRHIDNLVLLLLIVTPIGARFFSRLFDFPEPIGLWEALKVWKGGGLVFYGGLIFGIALVVAYVLITKISFLQFGDVLAPSLALGLAFGRVGCFLSGCCWGDFCGNPAQLALIKNAITKHQIQTFPALSPKDFFLAVRFPPETGAYEQHQTLGLISAKAATSLPVHPAQLYEAGLALCLCLLLNAAFKHRRGRGEVFAQFAIGYGVIRFAVEFFRADTPPVYFGMSISQVISIGIGVAGCALFAYSRLPAQKILPQKSPVCDLASTVS
ncbi:MAG: prolipoprotein diacylglyceryl transferase [Verrucomicrobiota bacterium]